MATLPPCRAKASARQITSVVFPTPPFVEQTLMTAIEKAPRARGPTFPKVQNPEGPNALMP